MHRRILCILVVGLVVQGTALAAEDMPSYRGADGSGVLPAWQGALVTDPKQAKVLWTSEERNFGVGWGYGTGPENKNRTTVMGCGFSGPVAVGKQVYFSWFVPSGDVVDDKVRTKGKDQRPEAWKIDADDLLVCLDAETGRTTWRAVMPGTGLNWGYHRKCPWTHPCVVDGKVYWLGSAGKVFCHAVADGRLVWESDTGEGFKEFMKIRDKMRAAKSVETWQQGVRIKDGDSTSPINASPCYADGVIVINDSLCDKGPRAIGTQGAGLVGLNAADGKLLWRIPDGAGAYVSPIPWRLGDRDLAISVAPERLIAVEPKTGKLVWEVKEPMGAGITPAVGAGYLLVQRHRVRGAIKDLPEGAKGLSCYRLGDGRPEKLWELEPGGNSGPYGAPVISGGRGYALLKKGLVCVDLETGDIVAGPLGKVGDGYQPLQASGGLLLTGSTLVKLDPKDFTVFGGIGAGREMYTPAFLVGGRVYVRGRLDGYGNRNQGGKSPPEPGCIRCVELRK